MNVPTGITACGAGGLAVADAWNHRVLIWHASPGDSHRAPDVVLGQAGFEHGQSNRDADRPAADTLFWPYCVAWDGGRLWVADAGNRRVLMWDGLPRRNGEPADLVLGQHGFATRDENGGHAPEAASMRWPHAIAFPNGGLAVADAGNNRVMLWRSAPRRDGTPADAFLGQRDAAGAEHNRGRYEPEANTLNMPYGCAVAGDRLVVADTANSRLLAWDVDPWPQPDAAASALAAQPEWFAKGDNRWRAPARDSVCWPYAVAVDRDRLLVADSGNNRVLCWALRDREAAR